MSSSSDMSTAPHSVHPDRASRPRPDPVGWDFHHLPTPAVDGPPVRCLPRNERGRDLVIGDVHGQLATFERLLEEVAYSEADGDRLLLLGDVIDRGPDSAGMLQWIKRPGVNCIRGNHEQLMLDSLNGDRETEQLWIEGNGGGWSKALSDHDRGEWHAVLRKMPLATEVEGAEGTFVLVHAEIPATTPWWALKAWIEEGDRDSGLRCLWSRSRIAQEVGNDQGVPDIWRSFHGHTPLRQPNMIGNMRWIDLGAAYASQYPGAALACVPIAVDGTEQDLVSVKVLDVDPAQCNR